MARNRTEKQLREALTEEQDWRVWGCRMERIRRYFGVPTYLCRCDDGRVASSRLGATAPTHG